MTKRKKRVRIMAVILLCNSMTAMAKEKAHITVNAAEGVAPTELVISRRDSADSSNSPYRTNLENGVYEIDIETDFIELYDIEDWTQLTTNSMTKRFAHFLIEDGAEITLTLYDDRIEVESSGQEQLAVERMKRLREDTFMPKVEEIEKIEDENEADEMYERLMEEISRWESDYYALNPIISFMLDLDNRLPRHRYNDHSLKQKLNIYHDYYAGIYPVIPRIRE